MRSRPRPPTSTALKALCTSAASTGSATSSAASEGPEPAAKKTWEATYQTIDTPERFATFLDELRAQPRFCIDTETTAIDPLAGPIWSGCRSPGRPAKPITCRSAGPLDRAVLDEAETLERTAAHPRPIRPSRRSARISSTTCWRSGRAGLDLAGPFTDTMVLSYLLESGERNHNLDQLSQRLLDHDMIPITDLIGKGKNQLRMDQVAVDRVAEYAGEDADATWRIEEILAAKVRSEGLWTSTPSWNGP